MCVKFTCIHFPGHRTACREKVPQETWLTSLELQLDSENCSITPNYRRINATVMYVIKSQSECATFWLT